MCWRMILFVGASVTAYQFNARDESDYVDNPDDAMLINNSVPIIDIAAAGKKGDEIQDEIEKLLRQPISHYEEPAAAAKTDNQPTSSTTGPTVAPSSTKRSTKFTQPTKLTDIPHWVEEEPGGHSALRQKHTRARQRTSEVVYSVRVARFDDNYPQHSKRFHSGLIESLVGAHDIVRFETRPSPIRPPYMHTRIYEPTQTAYEKRMKKDGSTAFIVDETAYTEKTRTGYNATWTAYNEGGIRSASVDGEPTDPDGRRQYLLSLPAFLVTKTTRRPRPTPLSYMITIKYPYTRRTRRNPNCTDSYYQCLNYCFDKKGYKVNCPWYTKPTRPEPARLNFTGLFLAIQTQWVMTMYDFSNIFWSFKDQLLAKGYRPCRSFTERTTTTNTVSVVPIYYDNVLGSQTGKIVAKCWVCGLIEQGIPKNANCYDNFAETGTGVSYLEKSSYRRYCRYMDEVPLWFNRSDPFSVWGPWTGGCSYRYVDLTGLYAQRACRSTIIPTEGLHYLSKRMALLELALRDQKEGCVVSPMASLVPFSRAVSLYARFHVCVCQGNWCNRGCRRDPSLAQLFIFCVIVRGIMRER